MIAPRLSTRPIPPAFVADLILLSFDPSDCHFLHAPKRPGSEKTVTKSAVPSHSQPTGRCCFVSAGSAKEDHLESPTSTWSSLLGRAISEDHLDIAFRLRGDRSISLQPLSVERPKVVASLQASRRPDVSTRPPGRSHIRVLLHRDRAAKTVLGLATHSSERIGTGSSKVVYQGCPAADGQTAPPPHHTPTSVEISAPLSSLSALRPLSHYTTNTPPDIA